MVYKSCVKYVYLSLVFRVLQEVRDELDSEALKAEK